MKTEDTAPESNPANPEPSLRSKPLNPGRPRRRFGTALALILLLGSLAAAWLSAHHIVRTEHGTAILRKQYLGRPHTWTDIRDWDHTDFQAAPALTTALNRQGYGDLVKLPPPPPPVANERTEAFRNKMQELSGQMEQSYQQAEKATREWALEVVNYWKAKLEK